MQWFQFKDLEITSTILPINPHLWVETDSSGTIYCVSSVDRTKVYKTTDKGSNWDLLDIDPDNSSGDGVSRDHDIQSLWYDEDNGIIWGVDCDNDGTADDFDVWKIDISDDSVTEVGTSSGQDANTVYVMDIFWDGSNCYVASEEKQSGTSYFVVYDVDTSPFIEKDKLQIYSGYGSYTNRRTYGLIANGKYYQFTVSSIVSIYAMIVYDISSSSLSFGNTISQWWPSDNSKLQGMAYDGNNLIYLILECFQVGDDFEKNYLYIYDISDDSLTKNIEYEKSYQLDRNNRATAPNEHEKAFDISKDSNNISSIYQIHRSYKNLLKLQEIEKNSNIKALTDNFLMFDDGTMYEYQDSESDIFSAIAIHEICKTPEGAIETTLNLATNQFIKLYDDYDILAFEGIIYMRNNLGNVRYYKLRSLAYSILEKEISLDYSSVATEIATIVLAILGLSDYLYGDATSVPTTSVTAKVKFEDKSIRDCLNTLADRCNGVWYLEPDGKVHFRLASVLNKEAHHWYGTYHFNNDEIGSVPSGWNSYNNTGCTTVIIAKKDNHKNVLELNDGSGTGRCIIQKSITQSANQIFEFWIGISHNVAKDFYILFMEGGTTIIHTRIVNDDFQYYDGAFHDIKTNFIVANELFHVKIVLNDTANTFDCYINEVLEGSGLPYLNNSTISVDLINFNTTDAVTDYCGYVDAIGCSADPNYSVGDNLKGLGYLTKKVSAPVVERIDEQINYVGIWGAIVGASRLFGYAEDLESQKLHGIIEWIGTTLYPEISDETELDTIAQSILDSEHAFSFPKHILFIYFKTNYMQVGETIRFTFDIMEELENYADYPILRLGYDIKANDTELLLSNGLLQGGGFGTPLKKKVELLERRVADNTQLIDQLALRKTGIYTSAIDPTVNDDVDLGYKIGDFWLNTSDLGLFVCVSATDGAANWDEITKV